jgi:hypothetical protein
VGGFYECSSESPDSKKADFDQLSDYWLLTEEF